MAHESETPEQFHEKARQPWITSLNDHDAEPGDHPMFVGNVELSAESRWADYWKNEEWDSKSTEEFHERARKPTIPSENEKDKEPTDNSTIVKMK